MANYSNLLSNINQYIKTNGKEEITGAILNSILTNMVSSLGAGYQFMGVASPSTNPGTPDQKVFYIAYTPGTYTNFGGISVTGLCVLKYGTAWTKEDIPVSGGGSYVLPIASANDLGGVKIGSGLSINSSTGVLSATGGGGGSVTSVAMSVPNGFSVTGSPITGSGTLAVSLDSQAKNKVLASPASASGVPSFRTLVASDIPDISGKYVTLDTTQNNISGEKTFTTNPVHIGQTSGIDVHGSSYIDLGDARIVYDPSSQAIHITSKSGNDTIGFYADGFVSAKGAAASGDQIKFVALTGNQSVDGVKTFLANIIANGTITINGVTITGSSSVLSVNKNASFAGISDRVNGSNVTHAVSIQDIVDRLVALENA